jgi:sodium/potassium/calcium exchanger 6
MLNVVMMFGVVSRVSHVILGLTVLAWCNSTGDLVADLAVAKQGFPRMAISV